MLCMKLCKALSYAFGREEEGTVLDDVEALTRNLSECIFYFYGEICSIPENVTRFLKNAFHILVWVCFDKFCMIIDIDFPIISPRNT